MRFSSIQSNLLYLFSFALVFEGWSILDLGGISLPKIFASGLVFISLFNFRQTFSIISLRRFMIPLLSFTGLLLFSFLLNYKEKNGSSILLFMVIQNILLFWIVTNIMINNPSIVERVLLVLNIAIFLSALLFMFGIGAEIIGGRLTLFGENPNTIGLFSAFAILFVFSLIFENKQNYGKSRYLLILLIIPLLNMVALSGSRVTFIGLILALAIFFILKSKGNLLLTLSIPIFGGIIIFVLYSYLMTFEVLRERIFLSLSQGDLSGRDAIWEYTLPFLLEKPLLGVGVNGYTDVISRQYGMYYSPHNVFIEVFAYTGLLGFIAYYSFFFELAKECFNIKKYGNYVLPILFFLLFLFVYLSGQALAVKFFWLLYAYIVTVRGSGTMMIQINR